MLENYTGSHRFLGSDDIAGIRSLYGLPQENSPIISPVVICTVDTLSVQNQPAGTTLTWSSSNPSGLSINATTGIATRQNNFNGQVTITVTIDSGCGNIILTRNVVVGTPTPTGISGPNYNLCRQRGHPQEEGTYYIHNPLPGVTYHWEFVRNTNQSISLGEGTVVWVNASAGFFYMSGAGTHTLRVRAFSCGQFSPWYSGSVVFENCSMPRFAIYPNPVSDVLNVRYELDSLSKSDTSFEDFQITLINSAQEKVYSCVSTEKTVAIPIGKFPKGTYYLTVVNKEGIIQRRILIDH